MAYPSYPPIYQQPMYQQPMYTQPQTQQIQQQVQPIQQMQSGGFISVPSEQAARNYPVAPGNVMTFKIENQPYVCEKSQGFSQLEGPIFNKYKLVKEEDIVEVNQPVINEQEPDTAIDDLWSEVEGLKKEIQSLKNKVYAKPKPIVKKKENDDE